MNEEEVQHKVLMFQLLQQHVEQLKQQAQVLEQQSLETEMTHMALEGMTELKDGSEVLIPFGNGMYGPGKSARSDTILVNIGSNVVIEKPVTEARKMIAEKKKDMEETGEKMQENLMETLTKLQQIAEEIQEHQLQQQQNQEDKGMAE